MCNHKSLCDRLNIVLIVVRMSNDVMHSSFQLVHITYVDVVFQSHLISVSIFMMKLSLLSTV